jgi:hypothetical protein
MYDAVQLRAVRHALQQILYVPAPREIGVDVLDTRDLLFGRFLARLVHDHHRVHGRTFDQAPGQGLAER